MVKYFIQSSAGSFSKTNHNCCHIKYYHIFTSTVVERVQTRNGHCDTRDKVEACAVGSVGTIGVFDIKDILSKVLPLENAEYISWPLISLLGDMPCGGYPLRLTLASTY